jgi:thiamine pyrophosphokinase
MIKIKNICYIIAACKDYSNDIFFTPEKDDIVIAADGGYNILKDKDIHADVLLGDFDSIQELPDHNNIIRYPVKKDDTDTFLAYKLGWENGYRSFIIFGGVGGRIDHTYANIQTLLNIAKNGGRAFLIGDNTIMTTIYNSKLIFSDDFSGNISIFAQGGIARNVTINGLKYCADSINLLPDIPLGVSNESIGARSEISVNNGALLIVWNETVQSFLKNIGDFVI